MADKGSRGISGRPSSQAFFMVYVVTALNQTCMFIYYTNLTFLYQEYGLDMRMFGYIMSASAFLTLCSSPVLGRLADAIGSRTVLILCLLSTASSHFTLAIATNIPMLLLSKILSVVQDCLPVSQMVITDMTQEAERSKYLGKVMIPMSVAMILGPSIGGLLPKYLGYHGTMMVTWVVPIIGMFLLLTFVPQGKKHVKVTDKKEESAQGSKGGISWNTVKEMFGKGETPYLLILRMTTMLMFITNFQVAGVTQFKLSAQELGFVGSVMGVSNLICSMFVVGYVNSHFTGNQILKIAAIIDIINYAILMHATNVWHLLLVLCIITLTYSSVDNQVMSRLTKSVDSKDSSTIVGIGTAIFHLSRTIGPTLGGVLMHNYGLYAIGALSASVALISAALVFLKKEDKQKAS